MTTIRKSYTFKNQPKYTTTITSKYKLNYDNGGDYPIPEYDIIAKKKHKQRIIYHCGDDYIEVPGGSDTVPYTDDEGNQYEIPLDDLIEYDGEDGEIQYTSGKNPLSKHKVIKTSSKKKVPESLLMHKNIQLAILQHTMNYQRIYS